jgi:hypothetical protein
MFAYHGKNQGERMRLTPIGVRNANSTFRKPWSFVWDAFVFKGQAITTSARHYQFFPRGLHTMPRWHTHFCNFRNTSAFPPIKLLTSPMLVEKCLQISKQVMKCGRKSIHGLIVDCLRMKIIRGEMMKSQIHLKWKYDCSAWTNSTRFVH